MKKEELKKYFEELNYDESLQNEILAYVDNEKDIESLYEKIKFLTKTGVPQEGIEMIINENPLFVLLLGLCPALSVTTNFENSYIMGLCFLFVLVSSNLIISLFRK